MIRELFKKFCFFMNHPKVGEVYYGDCLTFMIGNFNSEKILHRTTELDGSVTWEPVFGDLTYRIELESEDDRYYVCRGEMLVRGGPDDEYNWLPRRTKWRFEKERLEDMIFNGEVRKREFFR